MHTEIIPLPVLRPGARRRPARLRLSWTCGCLCAPARWISRTRARLRCRWPPTRVTWRWWRPCCRPTARSRSRMRTGTRRCTTRRSGEAKHGNCAKLKCRNKRWWWKKTAQPQILLNGSIVQRSCSHHSLANKLITMTPLTFKRLTDAQQISPLSDFYF